MLLRCKRVVRKIKIFDFLSRRIKNSNFEIIALENDIKACFLELATHTAISYIANTLSKCEIKVFENGAENKESKMYFKLNVSPNPNQSSSQFVNKLIEQYFYKGEALVINHNDNFYVCDSFATEKFGFSPDKYLSLVINGELTDIEKYAYDCFHFRLDNLNIHEKITNVYNEYGKVLSASMDNYQKNNGNKYKLTMENYRAGDTEFLKMYDNIIKKQLKTFLEENTAVYPQFKGFDLQEFQQRTSDNAYSTADVISMREDTFKIVAQAFKIPVSMLLGNITNMNEVFKIYITTCIDPLADMISEELTRKTSTYSQWKQGNKIKIDTSNINHIDILDVGDNVDKLIATGTCSIDEIRTRLDMEQLNTEFSQKHFITKNYENLKDVNENE